jgi:polysaccharide export outer membrane protein
MRKQNMEPEQDGVNLVFEYEGHTVGGGRSCGSSTKDRRVRAARTKHWRAVLATLFVFAGVALIAEAADTFTPTYTATPATPEYRLGPEDVIEVFVWKQPELTTTVVIRPDGRISLPLTNELEASGKTSVQLQKEITERLQEYITKPIVNVIAKQVNSLKISVLGEVRKPDVYRIKNQVTVLDAIAMAGGFTDLARPNRVIVIRNAQSGPQRIKINIKQLVADESKTPFYLQPLDTVYVE